MNVTCKAIRFLGLLGAGWLAWSILVAIVVSGHDGAPSDSSMLSYLLTVTIPYAVLAICLVLPYSKMKGAPWAASFVGLSLSCGYVCLYLVTHLPPEEWLRFSGLVLLFLSQPVVIWLTSRAIPRRTVDSTGTARSP